MSEHDTSAREVSDHHRHHTSPVGDNATDESLGPIVGSLSNGPMSAVRHVLQTFKGRGNGPRQVAAMLDMQRTYGNRATRIALQRLIPTDDKRYNAEQGANSNPSGYNNSSHESSSGNINPSGYNNSSHESSSGNINPSGYSLTGNSQPAAQQVVDNYGPNGHPPANNQQVVDNYGPNGHPPANNQQGANLNPSGGGMPAGQPVMGPKSNKNVVKYSNMKAMGDYGDEERGSMIAAQLHIQYKNWVKQGKWTQQQLDQWVADNKVNTKEMETYKVKYVRDEGEREQLELTGGSPLMQGKPPKAYDTKDAYSVHSGKGWAIYVMGGGGQIYAAPHKISRFHHSSFLAGAATAGAGELKVADGKLVGITNKSGHYQPGRKHMLQVLQEFSSKGVGLSGVMLKLFDPEPKVYPGGAEKFMEEEEKKTQDNK